VRAGGIGVLGLALLVATPAAAWGPVAHRVIARVAARHLSPAARREAARLLGGESLADVAYWADEIRERRPETARWHYVDIPLRADDYQPSRDCRQTPRGDCIIAALERERAALGDPSASSARRTEALRFVVHLVGDLHQPLHCADDDDRGGNTVKVVLLGVPATLHGVWDGGLLAVSGLTERAWVERVAGRTRTDLRTLGRGTIVEWALETHRAAVQHAYVIPRSHRLGARWVDANEPVVEGQLALAAVRLARVLNQALGR
jgi:nuclease S1